MKCQLLSFPTLIICIIFIFNAMRCLVLDLVSLLRLSESHIDSSTMVHSSEPEILMQTESLVVVMGIEIRHSQKIED